MYTEISIEYGQNKCAQKLLSSMDKINGHRNFYRVWTQKMCTEISINDGQNKCTQKKNGDRHDDSQTG